MTAVAEQTEARTLISPDLFHRLTSRVVTEHDLAPELAERIVDQALAFLAACAQDHREPLSPSPLVDIGWHTFILCTKDYAEFCERVAGRFLHHVPDDANDTAPTLNAVEIVDRAVLAIRRAGFRVDHELWDKKGLCSQCHNGCADDPPPNPPPKKLK